MLIASLDQILSTPFLGLVTITTFVLALLVGLTFHEFSHALSATVLGDPTPKRQGRLSLNPVAHLDPLGTAMIVIAGFGWARPVPVNPAYLRGSGRSAMAAVALAGPLANVLMATVAAIPINAGLVSSGAVGFSRFVGQPDDIGSYVVGSVVFWNLLLATFNLIPVAPLDGFRVALGVLPRETSYRFAQLERYGPGILLLLIMSAFVIPGGGILFRVMRPILNALAAIVLGGHIW